MSVRYRELLHRANIELQAVTAGDDLQNGYQKLLLLLAFCRQEAVCGVIEAKTTAAFAERLRRYNNLNAQAAKLLASMEETVPIAVEQIFAQYLGRLQKGEHLAYILGMEYFARHVFAVGAGVLIPREDSEILLQQSLDYCYKAGHRSLSVLELCCGTACISLSLLLELQAQLQVLPFYIDFWASDISPKALIYAHMNRNYYVLNAIKNRFVLCRSDLFESKDLQRRYDLILANPPYLSEAECQRRQHWHEPMLALEAGPDGLDLLRRIIAESPEFLQPGGALILEAAPWQMLELMRLLEFFGYEQISLHDDCGGYQRVIRAIYWP